MTAATPTTNATISAELTILRLDESGQCRMRGDHLVDEKKAPLRDPGIGVATFVEGDSDNSEDDTLALGFD